MEIDRRLKADRCEADYVYIPNNGQSSVYGHFSYAVDVQIILSMFHIMPDLQTHAYARYFFESHWRML